VAAVARGCKHSDRGATSVLHPPDPRRAQASAEARPCPSWRNFHRLRADDPTSGFVTPIQAAFCKQKPSLNETSSGSSPASTDAKAVRSEPRPGGERGPDFAHTGFDPQELREEQTASSPITTTAWPRHDRACSGGRSTSGPCADSRPSAWSGTFDSPRPRSWDRANPSRGRRCSSSDPRTTRFALRIQWRSSVVEMVCHLVTDCEDEGPPRALRGRAGARMPSELAPLTRTRTMRPRPRSATLAGVAVNTAIDADDQPPQPGRPGRK
jgi:hypothetical protein